MAVLVDAHAHFHPCFESDSFLGAAWQGFLRAAVRLREVEPPSGVLLLADPPGWDSFDALWTGSSRDQSLWTLEVLDEEISMRARGPDGAALTLIKGYQIRSTERLEVLALACRGDHAPSATMFDLIRWSLDLGAVTVAPWGFGKWFGARGRIMASCLDRIDSPMFFVGDSGARMAGTPEPALLARAAERGVRNLPGSDPFPMSRHYDRIGSRGFVLPGELDAGSPAASLGSLLGGLSTQPVTFGSGMPPLRFARSQLRMQIRS